MEDIADLVASYDAVRGDTTKLSATFLSNLLKELRKSKLRRPDIVLSSWKKVLPRESGAEVWSLYEQICVAALETGDQALADECIAQLLKKFPDSIRAGRLLGLQKEQVGEYGDALEIYRGLLSRNPSNLLVLRRLSCVQKALGDVKAQAEELHALLRLYPADVPAWLELADLHLSLAAYEAAAHCFEELVLLAPRNAHYHSRLADAYYSQGGWEQLLKARKHYSVSLTLQGPQHNLRALTGLLCASRASISAAAAVTAVLAVAATGGSSKDEAAGAESSSSSGGNGSSSAKTGSSSTSIEQEVRVSRELQAWALEQLQGLATYESGSGSSSSISSSRGEGGKGGAGAGPVQILHQALTHS